MVPAATSASDVLARQPDGVFLSNGPGDPAEVPYAVAAIARCSARCRSSASASATSCSAGPSAAGTFKLPFGHHGGNHPVQDRRTGAVEITSQNHNFAVDARRSPAGVALTHLNLNDGAVEGLRRARRAPAFSVQYHPEAGPGPHDSHHLFEQFAALMGAR